MGSIVSGHLPSGHAFDRLGSGPRQLVALQGLTIDTGPMGRWAGVMLGPYRQLADELTVTLVNRRPGLAPGVTMHDIAADVAALIRSDFGGSADLVGTSTGGSIALQVAIDQPDVVRRLVVHSAAYTLGPAGRRIQCQAAELARRGDWRGVGRLMMAWVRPVRGPGRVLFPLVVPVGALVIAHGHPRDASEFVAIVEAEDAFREGLRRDPDHAPMHEDFARLLWLRHGDLERASVALDEALERNPANASFWAVKAQLCATVGDSAQAYALFARAAALAPDVVSYELAASAAALGTQPRKALDHARSAAAREPSSSRGGLVQALLVAGDYDEASRLLEQAQREQPDDQQVLALQSVLWRLQGDARYGSLYDYARCVRAWTLDTPPGWSSLDAYLADLRETLRRMHAFRGHPPDQSLRGGSQTMGDLATHSDPVIRAFFDHAIAGPIVRHIEWLGHGDDPMRRRHGGRGRVHAAWSVLLQPEGFHVDHVHPDGWLSSACYIDLPGTLGSGASEGEGSREGWLRFGAVPLPLASPMGAEHYVRPEPGRLVLFPSYMWHGTVPFRGPHTRLTIAFDVLPA